MMFSGVGRGIVLNQFAGLIDDLAEKEGFHSIVNFRYRRIVGIIFDYVFGEMMLTYLSGWISRLVFFNMPCIRDLSPRVLPYSACNQ